MRQFATRYDGEDLRWRGEFWGKLMRGACLVYSYTKDEELYAILQETTEALLNTADGKGVIASYTQEREFKRWDMWCRKYVLLGLEHFYEICRDENLKEKIVAALCRQADYLIEKIGTGDGQISINQTSEEWGALNSVSVLQPFVKLYQMTGKGEYLRFAEMLVKSQEVDGENIFCLAFEDRKSPFEYPVKKAYEMISCFEGLLDYSVATGNEDCLLACRRYADRILQTDFTLVGGTGCDCECFDNATKTQVVENEIIKQETCVTVTLMKFLGALYRLTDDTRYLNAVETAFYNLYLGAMRDGEYQWSGDIRPICYSYSPLLRNPRWKNVGGWQSLSTYASFGCCISIFAAGLGLMPSLGAMASEKSVSINFYFGGRYELDTQEGKIAFTVNTQYPQEGNVEVTLTQAPKAGVDFRLRKPAWCNSFTLSRGYREENGYLYLTEKAYVGDAFTLDMAMPLRILFSKEVNEEIDNLFALVRGAIVLGADSAEVDLHGKYRVKTDETGNAVYRREGDGRYFVSLENGEELILREYRHTGKDYYNLREVSVWLERL